MKKKWYQQKTTWTGIITVVGAAGGIVTGTLPMAAALQTAATAMIGIFLRQGIESAK